ncbi:hypothetical protein N7462_007543 [Penicillium macrosclerotiorum]|uniref:uncharacterized protein n=1 Tax=Penicillium macrosclerotiorum TaxID=303699 RepID=UPI002548DF66|nr:uncharacterized protein N7462_007543 [Penicillium macrosclerotiorum]KAJ5679299.1 hypothetical protein N7462_007543 [Penicillium macrosclerotiorum]
MVDKALQNWGTCSEKLIGMDRQPLNPSVSYSRQSPQSHSLPDPGLQSMLDINVAGSGLPGDTSADWDPLNNFYFCSSEPANLEWNDWVGFETLQAPSTAGEEQSNAYLQISEMPSAPAIPQTVGITEFGVPTRNLTNVSQWLDGAYRPPISCSHCRKHRLQCLIIRTTAANPNPVTSCSSCVALFRECSLAKGEKRLPSGFETFSPGEIFPSVAENKEEQKESKQFVRKGARILREWFHQRQELPYPSEEEKIQLSRETGFSQKRISTWFANARRRQKQKLQSSNLGSASYNRAGSPLVTSTLSSMTPMERWQASPPEDDHIPESAIQHAIASEPFDAASMLDLSTMDFFNFDESSSHLASSVSSFGSKASETSGSVSSAWSHQSGRDGGMSFSPLPNSSRNRRRHKRQRSTGDGNQYQCTFCTQFFRKRHDWLRHEKSVHLRLDSWICTPNLIELEQDWSAPIDECRFCTAPFPSAAHFEEHEFHVCAEKPVPDRTFSRKDYLWQHLRKFHGCTKLPVADLHAWRRSGSNVQSRCGFCGISLSTWTARSEHLSEHFKNGARMEQWEGDWGLNPAVLSNLRNAVLPGQRASASPTT